MRLIVLTILLLGSAARAAQLTVFAAASLTDALSEVGQKFDARSGHRTTFQFAGSQTLRAQLERGARADVYASANAAQFNPLVRTGLVAPGQTFAKNSLAVIAPRSSRKVNTLRDLAKPGVKLVIADRAVPAGDHTRRMLRATEQSGVYGPGFSARVLKNVVSEEPSVRQVALKVGLGEADAAVVYRSDVTPALRAKVRVIELPTRFDQKVSYPIGVLRASRSAAAAQAFVRYVRSDEGQAILRKWGFQAPR